MGVKLPIRSENLKIVALSLIVATIFWFFNALSKSYDRRINYPLSFEFNKDEVVVIDPLPETIKIDVTSGGWNLLRKTFWFSAKPIKIELDNPTDIKFLPKASLLPIVSSQLKGLKINYLLTDTLFINIEPEERMSVKLQLDSGAISLAENYRIISPISLRPDTAVIIGPRSLLKELKSPFKFNVPEEDIDSDFDDSFSLPVGDRNIMSSLPRLVYVSFDVEEFELVKLNVTVETMNFPKDSSVYLRDTNVEISFWIKESDADDITLSDFNVIADLLMIQPDSTISPMLMYFPEGASEIAVSPDTLRVVNAK